MTAWSRQISPNNSGPRWVPIVGVIIHSTRGGAATPELEYHATIDWFLNPTSEVSAHRIIGVDGDGVICVDDEDIAWHAGIYNRAWFGVELVQQGIDIPFTEAQYKTLANLLKEWSTTYSFPLDRGHIRGHDEVDPRKSDPGPQFDWLYLLSLLEKKMDKEALTDALHEVWSVREALRQAAVVFKDLDPLQQRLFDALVKAKVAADIG